jgi:hypothetical protein
MSTEQRWWGVTGRVVPREIFERKHKEVDSTFEKFVENLPDNVISIERYNMDYEPKLIKRIDNEKATHWKI